MFTLFLPSLLSNTLRSQPKHNKAPYSQSQKCHASCWQIFKHLYLHGKKVNFSKIFESQYEILGKIQNLDDNFIVNYQCGKLPTETSFQNFELR